MSEPKITYRAVYDDTPRTVAEVDAERDALIAKTRELWEEGDESFAMHYVTHLGLRFWRIKQVGPPRFRWPRLAVRPWSIYVAWHMTAHYFGIKRPKAAS